MFKPHEPLEILLPIQFDSIIGKILLTAPPEHKTGTDKIAATIEA